MSKTIRRLKTLWWLSGIITEWPPVLVGGKPTKIIPTAILKDGEVKIMYEISEEN